MIPGNTTILTLIFLLKLFFLIVLSEQASISCMMLCSINVSII
jgi:hypothetical protein